MQPNYFVCTLGQAAALSSGPKPYNTIGEFLSYQAQHHGGLPAAAFATAHHDQGNWGSLLFTFADIDNGTTAVAHSIVEQCGPAIQEPQTVALLAHSSPEFLFTWLALIKLGHAVLLIAPQCQAPAILHLCKECRASILFHDESHSKRANDTSNLATEQGTAITLQSLSLETGHGISAVLDKSSQSAKSSLPVSRAKASGVAYLHHTSGTSSGLPKPIPQTHKAGLGVLPRLPESPSKATFTTTPLYHGGIADLFRAWTSNALIWFFPSKDIPVTAKNISRCLEVASSSAHENGTPSVRYFSSVPYILQMMEADEQGLALLQGMEIVGVGGAALPAEVGDRIVKKGVNLISRFGSAECGFLLSSFRNFETDGEWQYLRDRNPKHLLSFEARDDGLSELVIRPGWPHMAKTNRPDGSFATADLFLSHPKLPDAWLYHSRADSQLTLITGKKFDPAPLEAAIATSPLLDDVLVFGTGRPYPGALLLRSASAKNVSDEELLGKIGDVVMRLNEESQDHARISRDMLLGVAYQEKGLEKSSKGTIIRKVAEQRFRAEIEGAYEQADASACEKVDIGDEQVAQYLLGIVKSMKGGEPLDMDTELFSYGIDSIASMQLRSRLRALIPDASQELPLSVVEDCGTVRRLCEFVVRHRRGDDMQAENEEELMLELVEEYSQFPAAIAHDSLRTEVRSGHGSGKTVLLTGATGALGAHMLDLLRQSEDISRIYCLVRGADHRAARERVSKALEQRGLEALSDSIQATDQSQSTSNEKIQILQSQLSDPSLGLAPQTYKLLSETVDVVVHVAWTVNFRLKLSSFVKDNIGGLKNLLDFTAKQPYGPSRFVYCSSTAAVLNAGASPEAQDSQGSENGMIPEAVIHDPKVSSPLGYSRSKWVAEQICESAASHLQQRHDSQAQTEPQSPSQSANQSQNQTSPYPHISIVRVGQLSGASDTGIWNPKEAYPLLLSTARLTGTLPDLADMPLSWLPVDIAARALVQISLPSHARPTQAARNPENHPDIRETNADESPSPSLSVYHVLNPHTEPTWTTMLQHLQTQTSKRAGPAQPFEIVPPAAWLARLSDLAAQGSEHPALKLLGLWTEAYGLGTDPHPNPNSDSHSKTKSDATVPEPESGASQAPDFEMRSTKRDVPVLRDVRPLDREYLYRVWEWVSRAVGEV